MPIQTHLSETIWTLNELMTKIIMAMAHPLAVIENNPWKRNLNFLHQISISLLFLCFLDTKLWYQVLLQYNLIVLFVLDEEKPSVSHLGELVENVNLCTK